MAAKQDFRKLMQKQKSSTKVNHPMAKYNQLGQLSCVICNMQVKNELVWPAHLQSKRHKENINSLKDKKVALKTSASTKTSNLVLGDQGSNQAVKRPLKTPEDLSGISVKKAKESSSTLPDDFFDAPVDRNKALPTSAKNRPREAATLHTSTHPSDFFDKGIAKEEPAASKEPMREKSGEPSDDKRVGGKSQEMAEALPEGFFDDPKQDAKVRKVEYVDPQEAEWEKFQKMVTTESKVSDEIMEGEQEESEMVKDLTEYNKLKGCLSKVESLKQRQEFLKRKKGAHRKADPQETEIADSSEDLEGLFDWRSKKAL